MLNGQKNHFIIRLPRDPTHILTLLAARKKAAFTIQKWFKSIKALKSSEYQTLLLSLEKIRSSAALYIQKFYKGFLARKELSLLKGLDHKKLIRWMHEGHSVFILSNFTDPPWKELIPLTYSRHLKEHISTVLIERKVPKGTYCIKFLVDGKWMCDGNLAISQDQFGNYNNVILVNDQKNTMLRAI